MDGKTAVKTQHLKLYPPVGNDTPKKKLMTEVKFSREITPPHELPAAMARRCRERSRSKVQRLMASYIRRKRGKTSWPPEPPPRTVPLAAHPHLVGPSNLPPTFSKESDGHHSQDLNIEMAERTVAFGATMCLHDLDEGARLHLPVPLVYLYQRIWPMRSMKSSRLRLDYSTTPKTGASGSPNCPVASTGDLCSMVAAQSPVAHIRAPDTHDKVLRAIRVREVSDTASPAVADATEPESMKQLSANTAAIRKWVIRHKAVAKFPATMPVGPKGQVAWISTCALELAILVSGPPYPIPYLTSMPGDTLRSFGHAINSESHLAVIRLHTTHADAKLHDLCTGWAATADGQTGQIRWRTTDNIQRWRRFSKLQPDLLFATVVESVSYLNHWGVLNVLCVLVSKLAPIDIEKDVVMPQTNAVLYYLSIEVRAAVVDILCKLANWQPAHDLIAYDGNCWKRNAE